MRSTQLMMLFALAGGVAFATACGGSVKDSDPEPSGTPTGGGDDDDDDDDDDDTHLTSDGSGLFLQYYSGFGTVDGGAYTGAESLIVLGGPTQDVLCEFTWAAAGSSPSAQATPCTDADGDACEFTVDLTLDGGAVTSGCVEQGTPGIGPYDYTYGFISDYGYGGNGYGPYFMFYFDGDGWYAISPYASFDGTTFEYEAFFYQYAY